MSTSSRRAALSDQLPSSLCESSQSIPFILVADSPEAIRNHVLSRDWQALGAWLPFVVRRAQIQGWFCADLRCQIAVIDSPPWRCFIGSINAGGDDDRRLAYYCISSSARSSDCRMVMQYLRRLEVNHRLEPCRLLDRDVGRLGAPKYLVYVGCGAPIKIRRIWAVRHKSTGCN